MTTAVVFPGQGSQSLKMLVDIATEYSIVQSIFAKASEVLAYDLWDLTQHGPEEKLNQTEYTQPALLAASYAIWEIIRHKIRTPKYLAGHSLGEFTALVCAGSLDFSDAIKLVSLRGQFMQAAVPAGDGKMAAIIGFDEAEINALCDLAKAESGELVSPANYNSIGQVVISGKAKAVDHAINLAKAQGAKLAISLPVSVPSHCELMASAAEKLAAHLNKIHFKPTQIPVVNNAEVKIYQDENSIRDGLTKQLTAPVYWVETIQFFMNSGVTHIIECGPAKVLTGLNKRINKDLILNSSENLSSLNDIITWSEHV